MILIKNYLFITLFIIVFLIKNVKPNNSSNEFDLLEYKVRVPTPWKDETGNCHVGISMSCIVYFGNPIPQNWFSIKPQGIIYPALWSYEAPGNELIILDITFNPGPGITSFPLQVNISDISGNPNSYTFSGIKCNEIDINQFTLTKVGKPSYSALSNLITFYVQFNFNPDIPYYVASITCKTSSLSYGCTYGSDGYVNHGTVSVFIKPGYSSLSSKLTITLSFRSKDLQLEIDNLFPYNVTRTSQVLNEYFYPPIGSTIYQDYLGLSYNKLDFIVVKNSNSIYSQIVQNSLGTNVTYPFILVQSNQTHETYLRILYSNLNFTLGDTFTYISDSYSSLVSNNYSSTYFPFNIYGNITQIFETNDTTNANVIVSVQLESYISQPVLHYTINNYQINPQAINIIVPFPSGYNQITKNYIYNFSFPISKLYTEKSFTISPAMISGTFSHTPSRKITNEYLKLNSFEIIPVSWISIIIRFNVTTPCQLTRFVFGTGNYGDGNKYRVAGNGYTGVYEMEVISFGISSDYDFQIYDECQNKYEYYNSLSYQSSTLNTIMPDIPKVAQNNFTISNITYIKFSNYDIDLSNGDANVTLFIKLSYPVVSLEPIISLSYYSDDQIGYFDENIGQYIIHFTIPKGIPSGNVYYELGFVIARFSSNILESFFGDAAKINVKNSVADFIAPEIIEIYSIPSNNITIGTNENKLIGWNLRIKDFPNGFDHGFLQVVSDKDLLRRNIYISSSNLISGDKYDGIYSINFSIEGICTTQTFQMVNVSLYDVPNVQSNNQVEPYDPLTYIYGTIFEKDMKITVNCANELNDISAPVLVSLDATKSIDVGKISRLFYIDFSILEELNGSGISRRRGPVVQLISENGDTLIIKSEFRSSWNNRFDYNASQQLPYGFGLNTIYIGIYGIVDKYLNYRSYGLYDLKNSNMQYYINRTMTLDEPIIERSSKLTNLGGSLTIYGKSFGQSNDSLVLMINYDSGYEAIRIDFRSGIILQSINTIAPISSNFVKIKVSKNGYHSNELIVPVEIVPRITPTPSPTTPTPTPSKCPGTPECNNNGNCVNSICNCNFMWFGPSCSSKNVIIPPPTVYPNPTSGTNITESNNLITSSIEIVGIRELNNQMEVIESFNISNWKLIDLTKTNPKYLYSTQLDQRTTTLNITIEFFKNSTNITFADEELFIPQSSIKFTMNMDKYSFKETTNTIQILMKSMIQSDGSEVCSSQAVGIVNDNIQWIKLNIDERSLYGRFMAKGVIDNAIRPIKNIIVDDDTSKQTKQIRSVVVGITIPAYLESIYLDPDFSNLIDVGESDTKDFICSSKNKLSTGAIIGIVVGVVAVSISVALVIFIVKRRKFNRQEKIMKSKLQKL